ncbi:MAG: tetratricopeptide repeat protein [Candidatus Pacebacteria bacterium]|nr:tetratricopeptide repeat protein [Candidatus Paceibacterota bacterium]PIR59891.1 MAG: hypothetical protein COU67_04500 [Candidatus Pacebacteria bacterium CG10_big_fil_rev_8_21_14_0_10_44_54]
MKTKHLIGILISLALICYLPFLGNKLVWDDEQFIYSNAYVRNFDIAKIFTTSTTDGAGIVSNYYRPFTTLSFAIDHQFWGIHPIGYHLPNLLLHLSSGLLLFYLLRLLKLPQNASFWLSALFLIHPIQTEAVIYANSRGDSLYTFFTLLSLISFLYFYKQKSIVIHFYDQQLNISPKVFSIATPIFYLCGILSKEIGVASLGLFFLVLAKESLIKNKKQSLKKTAVFLLFSLVLIAVTYLWLRATLLNFVDSFNFYETGSLYGSNIFVRLLTFSKIIWIYCKLLFVPYPLYIDRSTELVASWRSIFPWMTLGLVAALSWFGWREYRRHNQVWIWLGLGWFFGMLAPVSGIIPINGLLYEHWLYVPMIGFFLCLFGLSKLITPNIKITGKKIHLLLTLFAFVLILLTIRQNYVWGTPIRLYTHLLKYTETARIHNNLAMAYADDHNIEKALQHYQLSLKLSQTYPQTFYNLANLYIATGQYEQAILLLETAVAIAPDFTMAQLRLEQIFEASAAGTLHSK